MGCGGNSDRILRHNSLRDAVFSAAQSAALAPRREAPSLVPGSQSRPADIYLPCWKRGRPAAVDVTVISTMQRSTIQGAAENQGHALRIAEERKFAAHGAACQAAGISFIPLAVETLGGLSVTAADTISSIGRLMGQRFGISPSESTRHLFHSGGEMQPSGSTAAHHLHPPWTELSDLPFCFYKNFFRLVYSPGLLLSREGVAPRGYIARFVRPLQPRPLPAHLRSNRCYAAMLEEGRAIHAYACCREFAKHGWIFAWLFWYAT